MFLKRRVVGAEIEQPDPGVDLVARFDVRLRCIDPVEDLGTDLQRGSTDGPQTWMAAAFDFFSPDLRKRCVIDVEVEQPDLGIDLVARSDIWALTHSVDLLVGCKHGWQRMNGHGGLCLKKTPDVDGFLARRSCGKQHMSFSPIGERWQRHDNEMVCRHYEEERGIRASSRWVLPSKMEKKNGASCSCVVSWPKKKIRCDVDVGGVGTLPVGDHYRDLPLAFLMSLQTLFR
ncbi:hypothetical protein ACLOJK_001881 [Asimina triloba]